MNSLGGMAKRIAWLKERTKRDPLRYFVPTKPQNRFINDGAKLKLLLGGNQVGKTAATCYLLIAHCLGRHPSIKTDPPPIEAFLVTHSHEQSRTIQQKLFDMIPKGELHPACEFVRGKGFRGMAPVVRFNNGSIIRIKTANQGLGLASATANLVCIDEPVPMDVFNELLARTLRGGRGGQRGVMAITMTPVGSVDVSYIEDMVNNGKISCTRAKLNIDDTTPMGLDPILSKQQIDSITDAFLPIDREARINGSFDVLPVGVIFTNFTEEMITKRPVPSGGDYQFCVGIDHGSVPNSQVAILCCLDMKEERQPRCYVLDEYISGQSTPEVHAIGILEMLERNSIQPMQCHWTGDGVHNASRGRDGFKMSNLAIMRGMESVLNLPHKGLPFRIRQPNKRKNSVYYSASFLHAMMARKHFWIYPRCKQTIKSIKNWTMKRDQYARSRDKYGHCIDALRYSVMHLLSRNRTPSNSRIEIR